MLQGGAVHSGPLAESAARPLLTANRSTRQPTTAASGGSRSRAKEKENHMFRHPSTAICVALRSGRAAHPPRFLADLGYSAAGVSSLWELEAGMELDRPPADIVVAQWDTAGRSGRDALREMHRRHPDVAVVLVVSAQAGVPAAEALLCGVYAYLREPLRLGELEMLLARLRNGALVCPRSS